MKKNFNAKNMAIDLLYDVAGAVIYSFGIQCFIASNKIAPGGVSGLSIIINYLTGYPIGTLSFVLNIPLFLLAYKFVSKSMTIKTLKTVAIFSVVLDFLAQYLPVYTGDMIIASLFGGVLMGVGLAIVFMRGSTTGGSDIASRLLQLKFPFLPIGRALIIIDFIILIIAAVVFKNIESLLYGIITIFATSKMIDSVLYGLDSGRMCLIISNKEEEIASQLLDKLQRGVTYLMGQGAYSGSNKKIILCAIRKQQFYRVKDLVYKIDPQAFIIVAEAGEILGSGFKEN